MLPNGNYQSTIFADAVIGPDGLPMSGDGDFSFYFLHADIASNAGPPDQGQHESTAVTEGIEPTGVPVGSNSAQCIHPFRRLLGQCDCARERCLPCIDAEQILCAGEQRAAFAEPQTAGQ